MTRTDLVFAMEMIRAIVTDIGGSLCHAAIVARERNIPCVVGTETATSVLRAGMQVQVNGTDGDSHFPPHLMASGLCSFVSTRSSPITFPAGRRRISSLRNS